MQAQVEGLPRGGGSERCLCAPGSRGERGPGLHERVGQHAGLRAQLRRQLGRRQPPQAPAAPGRLQRWRVRLAQEVYQRVPARQPTSPAYSHSDARILDAQGSRVQVTLHVHLELVQIPLHPA
jgi:hypothetical protein